MIMKKNGFITKMQETMLGVVRGRHPNAHLARSAQKALGVGETDE